MDRSDAVKFDIVLLNSWSGTAHLEGNAEMSSLFVLLLRLIAENHQKMDQD